MNNILAQKSVWERIRKKKGKYWHHIVIFPSLAFFLTLQWKIFLHSRKLVQKKTPEKETEFLFKFCTVRKVYLFKSQTHRSNESFKFCRLSREWFTNKCNFCNHTFPSFPTSFTCFHYFEGLSITHCLDCWNRYLVFTLENNQFLR